MHLSEKGLYRIFGSIGITLASFQIPDTHALSDFVHHRHNADVARAVFVDFVKVFDHVDVVEPR